MKALHFLAYAAAGVALPAAAHATCFDDLPAHSGLPTSTTVDGLTTHLSATLPGTARVSKKELARLLTSVDFEV